MVGDALDPSVIPTRESLELEIEAQFMKLRDRIEERAARKFLAREFDGCLPALSCPVSTSKIYFEQKSAGVTRRYILNSQCLLVALSGHLCAHS
jgi:hypothetical protein